METVLIEGVPSYVDVHPIRMFVETVELVFIDRLEELRPHLLLATEGGGHRDDLDRISLRP